MSATVLKASENAEALAENEIAWLSGFFDGEGCVHLNTPRGGTLTFTTTCRRTLAHVQSLLDRAGVVFHTAEQRPRHEAHATAWKVMVRSRTSIGYLAGLLSPYSVTKAEQWVVIAEWAACSRVRGRLRTVEERSKDDELRARLRSLNRRGPTGVKGVE